MRYDENRRVILETTLIRLASPETNIIEPAIMARLKKLEEQRQTTSFIQMTNTSPTAPEKDKEKNLPQKTTGHLRLE